VSSPTIDFMDASKYKKATTSRGVNYNYYYSPAKSGKPTILLVHGFPSTSVDWVGVVAVLEPQGFGLIVPDMLGYGGTDKPSDPAKYVHSALSQDLIDLLDVESIQKAVVVGHDWFVASHAPNICDHG
jgi:soluble epoxide hydrolase / lipid-phosphate phosphatase